MPRLFNFVSSTKENSIDACNSSMTNAVNCGDYIECMDDTLDTTTADSFGPICCTGYFSCQNTRNITATLSSNSSNSTYNYNTGIRCDGHESCVELSRYSRIASRNGDIFITAPIAAGEDADTTLITSQPENLNRIYLTNNLFCTGWVSCRNRNISNFDNLYCLARYTCQSTSISNINTIYAYGTNAAFGSVMDNIGNIYCAVYRSCYQSDISNVDGMVYGSGYRVLYQSRISNVTGDVIGIGIEALYDAIIDTVENVCLLDILASFKFHFLSNFGFVLGDSVNFCFSICSLFF